MSITYLTYKEIDKNKWDSCIASAVNGLVYGRSFYLDAMAEKWDALVLNDYEAVMPLTRKNKWGIRYLYQPAFIQQSGIFFTKELNDAQVKSFLELALQKFKFAEITLNFSNNISLPADTIQIQQRNNFILNLNKPYEEIYENYDPSFTKSLRRIKKFEMEYYESVNYERIIELYKNLYSKRLPFISGKNYSSLTRACKKLFVQNKIIVRLVRNNSSLLLAAVVLIKDNNRIYNIISCITKEGKKVEANYFLYDRIIHEFANTPMLFDFEGSDVPGIATFYEKFNPENQTYPFVRWNNLSSFVKLFKR
ncbi:MAG: hypothetical protein ABI402_14680 [Ferruginibacter sp.]